MISKLKKILYFPLAYYFRFFARIQLGIWKPIIIVVTGSSGKTTLLNLIESQIQDKAKYSHFANSSYGIPFDILGLHRKNLTVGEWPYLFLLAPFKAFRKPPTERLYVVEADCDRPYEGKFLASLLKPAVTLWTNVSRTHTMNFDSHVVIARSSVLQNDEAISAERLPHPDTSGFAMTQVEQAIAHEFGYFLEYTSDLAILNSDNELIKKESRRSKATIKYVGQKVLNNYKVFKDHTEFRINGKDYSIKALLPKETSYSIAMTTILLDYLNKRLIVHRHSGLSRISLHREENERDSGVANAPQNDERRVTSEKIKLDPSFSKFSLPPGRCNLFKGIKNTIIIDSSYNATPDGVKSILGMFDLYPNGKKWLVLGDMIELGDEEQEEHERLGELLMTMRLDKIILVGPRVSKYTYPKLAQPVILNEVKDPRYPRNTNRILRYAQNNKIKTFQMPSYALEYLLNNLKGGEVVLFKGARFLEGIIEHLLADKNDIKKLCRREKIWQIRRTKWGL